MSQSQGFAFTPQARHSERPNRIQPSCLTALGRQVRFRLFPTPPLGDAVTFSYTVPCQHRTRSFTG